MIQFLEDYKGVGAPPLQFEEKEELDRLRKDVSFLKDKADMKDKKE